MTGFPLFYWLVVSHFVMDFWAQSDWVAKAKCPRNVFLTPWYYPLTAHAVMHGAAVTFFTGDIVLGLAETLLHWLIDFGKCENFYGIHTDQAMHLLCKVTWVVCVLAGSR